MASKPTDRLKAIFAKHQPDDQQSCADLVSFYDRKLWHELTVKLRELFQSDAVLPDMLQDIFLEFISDFGHKLNLLSFAMFAHKVAGDMDRDAAVELLRKQISDLKELKGHPIEEPVLLLEMSVAEQCVDITHMDTCKELLDAGLQKLDTMSEVSFLCQTVLRLAQCKSSVSKSSKCAGRSGCFCRCSQCCCSVQQGETRLRRLL